MSDKKVALILEHLAEKIAPGDEIDLWPELKSRFQTSATLQKRGFQMNTRITDSRRLRFAVLTVSLALAVVLFMITPQGRALAQSVLHFFTKAESDSLPVQAFQLTPIPATTTPDPGDINNANLTVTQAEQQAGYDVFEPAWLPESLSLVGATFDLQKQITRVFYRSIDTNGLVLREEPITQVDDCELCGQVGASAEIEPVQINDQTGEYVEGVWNLTDQGPEWVSDPYLKTLRWQDQGMAFELLYMGPPDSLTKADLIAIAESIK